MRYMLDFLIGQCAVLAFVLVVVLAGIAVIWIGGHR